MKKTKKSKPVLSQSGRKQTPLVMQACAVKGFAINRTLVVIPSTLPQASELPEPVVEEEELAG